MRLQTNSRHFLLIFQKNIRQELKIANVIIKYVFRKKSTSKAHLKRILLDQGHCHIVCRPTEVCYLNSEADNTRVFLADGTWGSIDDSLIEMESVLPKDLFFRANRQNLINVDYVHSIAQGLGRDFIVNLKEPYSSIEFILTPEKKKELIEMLMYGSSSYQPE